MAPTPSAPQSRLRQKRLIAFLCAVPFLAVLALFEIVPLAAVATNSVHVDGALSLGNFVEILTSAYQRTAFQTSAVLSLMTAAIGVGLALPIARLLRHAPAGMQNMVLTYANIGANFTGFPIAFAFMILFGFSGSITLILVKAGIVTGLNIYSTGGLVLVYSFFQVPLGLLLLYPSLAAIAPEIEEAARLMGASAAAFWWRIGLPILAPSLASTFILLFANAMGTYATAFALVGGNANLVTIRIGELVAGDVYSDPNLADALAMLLVLALAVPVLVNVLIMKKTDRHG